MAAGHYIMICKLYKSKTEAPNSQPQQVSCSINLKVKVGAVIKHLWHPMMVPVCSPYGRTISHSDPGYSFRVTWLEVSLNKFDQMF